MVFENLQVHPDQLPRASSLELQPVDRRYLRVLMIHRFLLAAMLLAATMLLFFLKPSLQTPGNLMLAGVGLFLFAAASFFLTWRSFRYKAYAVRQNDIVYQKGWIIRSVRVCPFNRIQHCSVDAGLLDRRFGLASLSVYTAGGMQADMKLPGLPQEEAARLREFILSKINQPELD